MLEKFKMILNRRNRIIAFILVVVILIVSLYSCSRSKDENIADSVVTNNDVENVSENANSDNSEVPIPNVSVTVVEPVEDEDLVNQTSEIVYDEEIDDIFSMVCSAVQLKLENAGFTTNQGIAQTVENEDYAGLGIYYYSDSIDFFSDDTYKAVGFVEVVSEDDAFVDVSENKSVIAVTPLDSDEKNDEKLVCTYNYEDIGASHFIFQDKYVCFYQQSPMRVVYSVMDNKTENYDLTVGSLYDYDQKEYVYDESILGEYTMHSAVDFFSEEDYAELEKYLKTMSDEQLKAGYYVTDFTIAYISPESIQAYIDSEEDDTFFGYSVSELTQSLGEGCALRYTENGFANAKDVEMNSGEYDWKSFLTKVGIGCGIILIGAALAPVTGGVSFGCALLTVTEYSLTATLATTLGTVAVETVKGMIGGKTLKDALFATKNKALDTFANTFRVMAAVSSVGVASGAIKPTACFTGDTLVTCIDLYGNNVLVPIKDIQVGDYVLAYDEALGIVGKYRVVETYVKQTDEIVKLSIGNDEILTTWNHPFYSVEYNDWVVADSLVAGNHVLNSNGEYVTVKCSEKFSDVNLIEVYNLTVENAHTYYVGSENILVHNKCDKVIKNLRKKAHDDTWAEEVKAIKNGTSKYNWTKAQKAEILKNGKLEGYDVTHIIDVAELKGTVNQQFIASTKNTVILERETQHFAAHMYNWNNATNTDVIIEFLPWAAEKVEYMLAIVG